MFISELFTFKRSILKRPFFKQSMVRLCLVIVSFTALSSFAYFEDNKGNKEKTSSEQSEIKTDLHNKFYRQALFEYFQGKPAQALKYINQSKSRLGFLDEKSRLFAAGLQLSIGLQQQAKQTLLSIETSLPDSLLEQDKKSIQQKNQRQELLLVALLSLAEQYVAQGELIAAQQLLNKIQQFPKGSSVKYYAQYQVLSQLAYWPATPVLVAAFLEKNANDEELSLTNKIYNSPYIELNNALLLLEQSEDDNKTEQAIILLTLIKKRKWQPPEQTFWQMLFSSNALFEPNVVDNKTSEQYQAQAINDYASLLLAQLYVKKQQYDQAFIELKTFPKDSPYSESALFLFAFSAQQVKQYTIAYNLLNLLHSHYPYSHLGWQAGELKAAQVAEQNSLEQGWAVYQQLEGFYQQRIQELSNFERSFSKSENLLKFSEKNSKQNKLAHRQLLEQDNALPVASKILPIKPYLPESIWLQQALFDAELSSLYKSLATLDLLSHSVVNLSIKNDWMSDIIRLNQARKTRILSAVKKQKPHAVLASLLAKRDQLALLLAQATKQQDGSAFANQSEQRWLNRIKLSKQLLIDLSNHKSSQSSQDYQQRLQRIENVLTWQLKQHYPERVWQHKKQLQAVDKTIIEVKRQQARLEQLIDSQESLSAAVFRQQQNESQIKTLLNEITKLRSKVTDKIRIKVAVYSEVQHSRLANHLLSTRRAMANVLEQMSINDKKIERQLSLDESPQQIEVKEDKSE